jgi:outer membrane protein OmpA-like peptidoglycan-associated protein
MRARLTRVVSSLVLAGGMPLWTASCSSVATNGRATPPAVRHRAQYFPLPQRIVQLAYGQDAVFGICIEPACPAVTPKTPLVTNSRGAAAQAHSDATDRAADGEVRIPHERLTLRFAPGASALDPPARQKLDAVVPAARRSHKIVIVGRTDNVGSEKANQAIALARALQVRAYLRRRLQGADNIIEIDARGACCFISSNETPDGRQANRRVEVVFSLPG